MSIYNLKIADFFVRVNFACADGKGKFSLPAQYKPFLVTEEVADDACLFHFDVVDALPVTDVKEFVGKFTDENATHEIVRLSDGGYRFSMFSIDKDSTLVYEMLLSADYSHASVRIIDDKARWLFGFNNAIMIAFALSAAPYGTLLMHSSVTMFNGNGYLFLGKSGTGKSTHSGLWLKHVAGSELLNDDNPVVRYADGKATVYGSPWSGKTPCYRNLQAPAQAFVMLEQKPYNRIRRSGAVESLVALLESCSTMTWDKITHGAICKTISDIISCVSIFHLECLPDEDAVRVCKGAIVP